MQKTNNNLYISIGGNIGVGKTTCLKLFRETNVNYSKIILEPEANIFLEDLYLEPNRWAFHSQCFYFCEFLKINNDIESLKGFIVQERGIIESFMVFTPLMLELKMISKREFDLLRSLFFSVKEKLTVPDYIFILDAPAEHLINRIRVRNRIGEEKIDKKYLKIINKYYDKWLENTSIPHMRINATKSPELILKEILLKLDERI